MSSRSSRSSSCELSFLLTQQGLHLRKQLKYTIIEEYKETTDASPKEAFNWHESDWRVNMDQVYMDQVYGYTEELTKRVTRAPPCSNSWTPDFSRSLDGNYGLRLQSSRDINWEPELGIGSKRFILRYNGFANKATWVRWRGPDLRWYAVSPDCKLG